MTLLAPKNGLKRRFLPWLTSGVASTLVLFAVGLGATFGSVSVAEGASAQNQIQREAEISDVRIGQHGQRTRVVLDVDRELKFEIFTLPDPYRVVVNLPEVLWKLDDAAVPENKGLLSRMRYGLFAPGTSRMVLDVKGPVNVANSFMLKPVNGGRWRFVMDLAPTSETEFLEALAQQRAKARQSLDELVAKVTPDSPPVLATPTLSKDQRATSVAVIAPRRPSVSGKRIIAIDAGHGGVDPGTIGVGKTYEKNVTLAMARDLRTALEATGRYKVVLTRDRDIFLRLRDRVQVARDANADLFISIHADSVPNRKTRGLSIYTLSERASDKEAAKLAAKENKSDLIAGIDLSSESKDVTNILLDLAQRETMNQSARLAQELVGELRRQVMLLPNSHRFAGFAVLKAPDMPSVLVEAGFLSNRQDERNLLNSGYRQSMAGAMVKGIDQHFIGTEEARIH
ncbi:N-acetylmuramoyl-L-alanine amidase [Magnetovibrio blakemorei]|uniref:N-acetylmuramoyl-L-alanine amidase n=1 Tax=Magnetovibrio blakemorei TaxID=28181 RepID=UPI000AB2210A|nr:N-acetylmuramoyl-L-alanine amidase [Magnetovibrio blakemorei]